uniref:(northern house mosquito) hypothetical protein n=1 Tax=Culex pipiens TaxID=7175 RepID=A0A8D8IGA1_CULPI
MTITSLEGVFWCALLTTSDRCSELSKIFTKTKLQLLPLSPAPITEKHTPTNQPTSTCKLARYQRARANKAHPDKNVSSPEVAWWWLWEMVGSKNNRVAPVDVKSHTLHYFYMTMMMMELT